jgi:hypothetical protein
VITEYEIEDDDETFLDTLNSNKLLVSEDMFEKTIDFLEKQSYEAVSIFPS